MTAKDYTLNCQVCASTYHPVLKLDGTPRKTKYQTCGSKCLQYMSKIATGKRSDSPKGPTPSSVRVYKDCAFCGEKFGPMLTSQAKRRTYCTRTCASRAKTHTKDESGLWVKMHDGCKHKRKAEKQKKGLLPFRFNCHACGEHVVRFKRQSKKCDRCEAGSINDRLNRKAVLAQEALSKLVTDEARLLLSIKAKAKRYAKLRAQQCMDCSAPIKYVHGMGLEAKLCDKCKAAKKRASRRISKAKRRARIIGTQTENIDPFDIFDRDKWRCHLCGIKTLKSLRGTYEDRAPELEHIYPLSLGGTHTWDNVACSCRKCNQEKGAAVLGRLGLIL